jgi:hypothetical protein
MSEEIKKYRVLKPVAISGIVQPGAIVELTEAEAANIGIGEYLEEVADKIDYGKVEETDESKDDEESDEDADTETQVHEPGSSEADEDSGEVA